LSAELTTAYNCSEEIGSIHVFGLYDDDDDDDVYV
jgi:hypothetical protein